MKRTLLLLAIITPFLLQNCKKDEVVKKNEFSIGETSYTIENVDITYKAGGVAEILFFTSNNNLNAPLMYLRINSAGEFSLAEGVYSISSNQALAGSIGDGSQFYDISGGSMEIIKSGEKYIFEFNLEANGKQITGYFKDVIDIRTNKFKFQGFESIISDAYGLYIGSDSVIYIFDTQLSVIDTLAPYLWVELNSFYPALYSFTKGTYNFGGSPLGFGGALIDNYSYEYLFNGGSIEYSNDGDYATFNFGINTLDGNITGSYTGMLYIIDITEPGTKSLSTKKGISAKEMIKEYTTQKSINRITSPIRMHLENR